VTEIKPLKGTTFPLNEASAAWIAETLHDLRTYFRDDIATDHPEDVLDMLERNCGWKRTEDEYGKKAYNETPCNMGARIIDPVLRVTVVLTRHGELRVDIRGFGIY
jgi:hypothetical protein